MIFKFNLSMEKISFIKEIKVRFLTPWTSVFTGYLLIVVFSGGISVFFTALDLLKEGKICEENFKIAESLGTFFIAIIATAFIDLNLCNKVINKKAFGMWSYILAGFSIFLLWITYQLKGVSSFIPSLLGVVFALSTWVVANAYNSKIIFEDYSENINHKKETLKEQDDEFQQ